MVLDLVRRADAPAAARLAGEAGLLPRGETGRLKANRERGELEEKLAALGLTAPWTQEP